ncbi:S-type anion channel SLAH2-like [Dioscorea cayenensis subsp. rotundata]|uniref:S-type anion channel SLAH2-like n=1 Tax=Dioscorea cayennensis subsp. rotundata TaxID=55577 RepID=A0AB40BGS1_DIOCR|nr:S-type anion channel SLAH2-like [Dioscorea cayenensis subsp. rotundata]
MEKKEDVKQANPEEFPSLIKYIASKSVKGFDTTPNLQVDPVFANGSQHANTDTHKNSVIEHHHSHSISISLPASPSEFHAERAKRIPNIDNIHKNGASASNDQPEDSIFSAANSEQKKHAKFHSQPMSFGDSCNNVTLEVQSKIQRQDSLKDKRFDSFKTFSGKLERQISNLRGIPQPPVAEYVNASEITEEDIIPAVDRYFDALQGPELDTLKASEESVLPEDKKWPFLLRFPITSFGICLGISSQAILWKALATSPSTSFLNVSLNVNLVLWSISIALMGIVSLTYFLKIIFYFEAVRREYYHPVRVNFFFAPWIACLFLTIGLPPSVTTNLHKSVWYVLMIPILCLELKIYGQWMSGGQRRLSKVANPSNHLSIVGNFVVALLGASMGLKEGPIFFFAVGLAHYIVLFVTLYQRLPTNETLPKELHPVFFLFVAAPSVACMAWAKINDDFNYGSRIAYFIALFLYFSLAVRINFFRGFRFSLAWWAYTFPTTGAAIATIRYSTEVKNVFTQTLSVALSSISTVTVTALLVSTIIHALVLHDLFPNDISIAIAYRKPKSSKKNTHIKATNSDAKDIEAGV